jgi:hypothetical protein
MNNVIMYNKCYITKTANNIFDGKIPNSNIGMIPITIYFNKSKEIITNGKYEIETNVRNLLGAYEDKNQNCVILYNDSPQTQIDKAKNLVR